MIEAIAAMLAGKGKPEAEAVPEAKASPSFAPIRATICGIIWATAYIVCPAISSIAPPVPPIASPKELKALPKLPTAEDTDSILSLYVSTASAADSSPSAFTYNSIFFRPSSSNLALIASNCALASSLPMIFSL